LPDLIPIDVRNRGVEWRRLRVGDGVQRRDYRAVVALQIGSSELVGIAAVLDALDRAIVVLPDAKRLALRVLELTVVARGLANALDRGPKEPRPLIAKHILLGVVAPLVLTCRRLDVLGIVALHQPVVALS